ncbi:ABC transporter ATP-binding protein [Desulfobaculum bizertense]|uniref:Thiamine transport system ATP-binding protein n=1 Tax=Desulfobaculum bizertense DSM 18034 TaxID=1121442 RepID=A0A1T4VSX7_9BACT|nr:ABC transporter ATP-binding protein [Desulfobaculum bizertense]SKA68073.1 thiamine transport system ATP-binding protein [Desulfobaculum bizertense DSM 18034]
MPLLTLHDIRKRFDAHYALRDINLSLEAGQILCFLGPSGCGKTTLLRIIAGLEKEYSGSVSVQGVHIDEEPPHTRGFGLMFQDYALFPHMNVWDNVAFGLRMHKTGAEVENERVADMLRLVGLEDFASRKIQELSGGERQRVALARSLAPEPRLLMLDEPLAALDRSLRERLARELRQILKKVGVTAIFVTHDQAEAFAIADKVAVFHDGRLLQNDSPQRLYSHPTSIQVAEFLGFKNIVPASVLQDGTLLTPLGTFPVPPGTNKRAPGMTPSLLFRPEGAQIATPMQEATAEQIQLTGQVESCTFLGHVYQTEIKMAEGIMFRFLLPTYPSAPKIGEKLRLILPAEACVVLDSDQRPG